jgi:triacylglycerol lipase
VTSDEQPLALRQIDRRFDIARSELESGGALAALAAKYAVSKGVTPCAVYTFGMPREGGDRFCVEYSASLGANTYRLVHGDDIVPRVPMPALGFHHVGRMVQCEAETKFNPAAPLSVIGSDEPRFPSVIDSFADHVASILGRPGPMGGVLGETFRLLPPDIRHHLQDWYLEALDRDDIRFVHILHW